MKLKKCFNYDDNLVIDKFARVVIDDQKLLSQIAGSLQIDSQVLPRRIINWICNKGCGEDLHCGQNNDCNDALF